MYVLRFCLLLSVASFVLILFSFISLYLILVRPFSSLVVRICYVRLFYVLFLCMYTLLSPFISRFFCLHPFFHSFLCLSNLTASFLVGGSHMLCSSFLCIVYIYVYASVFFYQSLLLSSSFFIYFFLCVLSCYILLVGGGVGDGVVTRGCIAM